MTRIVFTADNHLGRYYAKMGLRQLAERRARLRQAFAEVVDYAIQQRVHLFLHGGDLFDREAPPPAELTFVAQEFQKLRDAGIHIFAVSGNHDMPRASDGATPVRIYDALRAARVFTKRTEIEFDILSADGARVAVGGLAPDPRLEPCADPLDRVAFRAPRADATLLLMHCGFEGNVPPDFRGSLLTKSRVEAMAGIDYFLLGDIHRTHRAIVGPATVLVSGATERMGFGERDAKTGYYYIELEGRQPVKLVHRAIEPQAMRRETIRTTDLPAADPTGFVFDHIKEWAHPEQMMQLRIEGPISREVYHRLHFFDIWRLGSELNFFFDLDRAALRMERETAGIAGPDEAISAHREIELVADELAAQREGAERELIEEARELVLQKLQRVE